MKPNYYLKIIKSLVSLFIRKSQNYLYETGWVNSFKNQMPVDKNFKPLPWVTYSFIDFISDRLNKNMDVFEYGSGNSTHWYAYKTRTVVSVEHDENWYNIMKSQVPENASLNFEELEYGAKYCRFSNTINKKFDIIIVDGRDRVNCIKKSFVDINDGGVIVLDDSERKSYQEGIEFLLKKNFKKIDFWGISPGLLYKKNTTIFYKQKNCLDI